MKLRWNLALGTLVLFSFISASCVNKTIHKNGDLEVKMMSEKKQDSIADVGTEYASDKMIVNFQTPPHSGFFLRPIDDDQLFFLVKFDNKTVEIKFQEFFHNSNLKNFVGKVIICECYGHRDIDNDEAIYYVKDANFLIQ